MRLLPLLLLILTGAGLAGAVPASAAGAPVTPAASAAMATASPTLERIKKNARITFAYRDGARPFSFRERGQVRGYSAELCMRVAARLQKQLGLPELRIEWTAASAPASIDVVAEGKADAACGTATMTLHRMQRVDFSLPIYVDGGTVLVRADAKLPQLADLNGRKIAVTSGTTTETALQRGLAAIGAKATLVPVTDGAAGMALLAKREVDGYAGDRTVLVALRAGAPNSADYAFIAGDFSIEPYALVLPRNDPDFRLAVNGALVDIFRTGEVDGIFQRWLAGLGEPSPLLHALIYLNTLPE